LCQYVFVGTKYNEVEQVQETMKEIKNQEEQSYPYEEKQEVIGIEDGQYQRIFIEKKDLVMLYR